MSSDFTTFELTLSPRNTPRLPSEVLNSLAQAFRCSIEAFGLFEKETPSRLRFELKHEVARRIRTPDALVASTRHGLEWWQLKRPNEQVLPSFTQWQLSWTDEGAAPSPGEVTQALSQVNAFPLEYSFIGLAGPQHLLLISKAHEATVLPEGPLRIGERTFTLSRLP